MTGFTKRNARRAPAAQGAPFIVAVRLLGVDRLWSEHNDEQAAGIACTECCRAGLDARVLVRREGVA